MIPIPGRSMVRTSDSKSENQGSIPCRGVFLFIASFIQNHECILLLVPKIELLKISFFLQLMELVIILFSKPSLDDPFSSKSFGLLECVELERLGLMCKGRHLLCYIMDSSV